MILKIMHFQRRGKEIIKRKKYFIKNIGSKQETSLLFDQSQNSKENEKKK
jgi:hypothetical protein